jgi:hypothetical protein
MDYTDIEAAARAQFNAVGDTFFSTTDFTSSLYQAQLILAREALCIEATYTTTTVVGTQEYSYPTNTISIKRVTYDGKKIQPINLREDDALTLGNSASTATGTPAFYYVWDDTIYLRPIPDDDLTLKIYSYNEPSEVTSASTIEVPTQFHMDLVEYILSRMYAKDGNIQMAQYHLERWNEAVQAAKKWAQKRKRGDGMPVVGDEETLAISIIGTI